MRVFCLLIAIMLCFALCACGSEPANTNTTDPTPSEVTTDNVTEDITDDDTVNPFDTLPDGFPEIQLPELELDEYDIPEESYVRQEVSRVHPVNHEDVIVLPEDELD